MKIIGHTSTGFIVEINGPEMTAACGRAALSFQTNYNTGAVSTIHHLPVGTVVDVQAKLKHIDKLQENDEARKKIAEQLRAAAVVIETTLSPFTLPEPLPKAKSAADELRAALE